MYACVMDATTQGSTVTTLEELWALDEWDRVQFFKRHRGLQQRVVGRSGRDQSVVSRVANGRARAAEVERIFDEELAAIAGGTDGRAE